MQEVEPDNKWLEPVDALLESTGPNEQLLENQMVIITLLMRLYDVSMANLSVVNKTIADELYDAHERGEHSNPMIYIPVKEDGEG